MVERKRLRWLLLAALLLIGAGLLTWLDDDPRREQPEIEFPDEMRSHEEDRMRARQRLLLLSGLAGDPPTEIEADPFMVALNGAAARGSVMVFELDALAESPVGQLIVSCFKQRDADKLEELKKRTGFDPFEALDRAAVSEDLAILEGEFFLDTTAGSDTFKTVKNLGPLGEWSFSLHDVVSERGTWKGEPANLLKSIRVKEVSPVLMGAGINTRTLAAKSRHTDEIRSQHPEVYAAWLAWKSAEVARRYAR